MKLERIKVSGFKSFRELDLEMRLLNVLIGANGSGKSSFFSVFQMLDAILTGGLQTFVARSGGANALLHYGRQTTQHISLELAFDQFVYGCVLEPSSDDKLFFAEEKVWGSEGYATNFGNGHFETDIGSAKQENPSPALALLNSLRFTAYHFHDIGEGASVEEAGQLGDHWYLQPDAANLAAVLYHLQQKHPRDYAQIRGMVQLIAPFFDDFVLRHDPLTPDTIRLEWRERKSDFPFLARQLSGGTLRFIGLATTLLCLPAEYLPPMILVDGAELELHPLALEVLASLIRQATRRTQIVISTQSAPLVSLFEPEDLVVIDRHQGISAASRVDVANMKDWLEDYSLGELWEKNVLGGRPSR